MKATRRTVSVVLAAAIVVAAVPFTGSAAEDWDARALLRASDASGARWRWSYTLPVYGTGGISTVDDGDTASAVSGFSREDGETDIKGFWSGFRFEKHWGQDGRFSTATTLIDAHPGVEVRPSINESWEKSSEELLRIVVRRYYGSDPAGLQGYAGIGFSVLHNWAEYQNMLLGYIPTHDEFQVLPTFDLGARFYFYRGGGSGAYAEIGASATPFVDYGDIQKVGGQETVAALTLRFGWSIR